MNPGQHLALPLLESIPRVSGDEPSEVFKVSKRLKYSPRERG